MVPSADVQLPLSVLEYVEMHIAVDQSFKHRYNLANRSEPPLFGPTRSTVVDPSYSGGPVEDLLRPEYDRYRFPCMQITCDKEAHPQVSTSLQI